MATSELEAAALRPGDVAEQRFSVTKRGYDPDEVHRFLRVVADHLARLQGEIEWQRARVEHLEQRNLELQGSAYDRISREFMDVVRRAEEAASQVRDKADDQAGAVLAGARQEADRMIGSAAHEAERILLTARAEAERLVAEASRQVELLVRDAGSRAMPAGPGSGQANGTSPLDDFEHFDLGFDGSMFDLMGQSGQ
jgi:DivIVA domain-containing protein